MVSTLAMTDALAKLLIEKGVAPDPTCFDIPTLKFWRGEV
jgi:hypothetical protein